MEIDGGLVEEFEAAAAAIAAGGGPDGGAADASANGPRISKVVGITLLNDPYDPARVLLTGNAEFVCVNLPTKPRVAHILEDVATGMGHRIMEETRAVLAQVCRWKEGGKLFPFAIALEDYHVMVVVNVWDYGLLPVDHQWCEVLEETWLHDVVRFAAHTSRPSHDSWTVFLRVLCLDQAGLVLFPADAIECLPTGPSNATADDVRMLPKLRTHCKEREGTAMDTDNVPNCLTREAEEIADCLGVHAELQGMEQVARRKPFAVATMLCAENDEDAYNSRFEWRSSHTRSYRFVDILVVRAWSTCFREDTWMRKLLQL